MRRTTGVVLIAAGLVAFTAGPAFALNVSPDTGTDMVAGNVYALDADGGWMYAGGKVSAIRDVNNVDRCPADNLVRFGESTGVGDCSFTPTLRRACCRPFARSTRGRRSSSAVASARAQSFSQ